MARKGGIEGGLEQGLFASRWLMAPMYLGLVVALAMLVVVFLREVGYYAPRVLELSSDQAILAALTLIDLTLAANLLLIVLFSGYENFVSKLDVDDGGDRPVWMGTVDFGGLSKTFGAITFSGGTTQNGTLTADPALPSPAAP